MSEFDNPDGVYFGMSDALYRKDTAIGSTDHKSLAAFPEGYWWDRFGPDLDDDAGDTPARALGRGVHAHVLEGADVFKSRFVRRPAGLKRVTEKDLAIYCPRGETMLGPKAYDRVLKSSTIIRSHPDLREALTNGFPEVSIIYTVETDQGPVRCKARVDYFKPRAIVDLKSINPMLPVPFKVQCIRSIRKFKYEVQTDQYLEAREEAAKLIRAGKVWVMSGPRPSDEWLQSVVDEDFAFVWIFWASAGPPLVWTAHMSPGNPRLAEARSIIIQARRNYLRFVKQFGLDRPWVIHEPISELTPDDFDAAYGQHI